MSTEVYVVYSAIQFKWETECYIEIEGVAFSEQGARKLEESARKRKEVLCTDCEVYSTED